MYKVGDWVIHRLDIGQVIKLNADGTVREFSDGAFSSSSNDLNVRPLTLRNKRMAEVFKYYEKEIRSLPVEKALNWPDIHGHLVGLAYQAMDTTQRDGETNAAVLRGQEFVQKVRDQLRNVDEVDGIRLFRYK